PITDLVFKFALDNYYTFQLIARAFIVNGNVYAFVAPQFIEATNPLASFRNEFISVQVQGAFADKLIFIGTGAGSYPTGSAVLSDISALSYDYTYEYKKLHQESGIEFSNNILVDVYVSFDHRVGITIADFEGLESGYAANGKQYMVG